MTRGQEDVFFGWMEFAAADRRDVSLCISEILQVHIAPDGRALLLSIVLVDAGLIVRTTDEEQTRLVVTAKAERGDRIAVKRSIFFERPHRA